MSRETLKAKIIEVLKEVEANQITYIVQHNVCTALADTVADEETIGFGKDVLRKYVAIINLKEFLENDEYDPFLEYSAKYPADLYPGYPEGVTIWEIDDTDIRMIEDDPKMFNMVKQMFVDYLNNKTLIIVSLKLILLCFI